MKKLSIFATLAVMGAMVVGCGATNNNTATNTASNATGAATTGQATIKVAADTTFPPFESEQNGKVSGFDIAMINAIAKQENLKVDMSTMPFTGLIPALQTGQADVAVAGITIKTSRMQAVNFSNAYYKSGLSVLVKTNSKINSLSDLKGKLVATKKGTSSVDLLTQKGITNIKQFDNIDDAYNALESGGADAVVFDNPVNINFENSHKDVHVVGGLLTGEYYGIAVSKKDADLLNKINDGLKKIQDDGEYAKLFDQYLGGDKSGVVDGVKDPASVAVNA
jgi:glutamine transport system substrate-binding protein